MNETERKFNNDELDYIAEKLAEELCKISDENQKKIAEQKKAIWVNGTRKGLRLCNAIFVPLGLLGGIAAIIIGLHGNKKYMIYGISVIIAVFIMFFTTIRYCKKPKTR